MLQLSTAPQNASHCPAPKRFTPALRVRGAKLCERPVWIKRGKSRGKFAVGVRYERRVHEMLSDRALGDPVLSCTFGQWLEFQDASGRRYCQVDALLARHSLREITICEIKYNHTSDAWWQLKHLYEPVIRALYPNYLISLVEIVSWHDPAAAWPEQPVLVRSLDELPCNGAVGIHIWTPKRGKDREGN